MQPKMSVRFGVLALLLFILNLAFGLINPGHSAWAAPTFATNEFRTLWEYSDKAVEELPGSGRGYTWGPNSFGSFQEDYQEAAGGKRVVQYFDKSRMELSTDSNGKTFVTNGLLTKELVTGKRQDGDNKYTQLAPSTVQVAGDNNAGGGNAVAPVYASFKAVVTFQPGENVAPDRIGQDVSLNIDKNGLVTTLDQPPASLKIDNYFVATGHNVPAVFSDFLNLTGKIWDGNQYSDGKGVYGSNPIAVTFGYPISEAYWVSAVVAGQPRNVLVQLFERRVLTYTPANSDPYKVEMGNIGQHYYQWRYINKEMPPPTSTPLPVTTAPTPVTTAPTTTLSVTPTPTPTPTPTTGLSGKLVYDIIADDLYSDQIYTSNPDASNKTKVVQGSYPLFAPDGKRLAFLTDLSGTPGNPAGTVGVRSVNLDGSGPQDFCKLNSNDYALLTLERYSPDGGQIVINAISEAASNLFLCNLLDKSLSGPLKYKQGLLGDVYDWTSDGKNALWQAPIAGSNDKSALYYGSANNNGNDGVAVTNGQNLVNSDLNDTVTPKYYASAALSPDHKTVAVGGSVVFLVSVPGQKSPYDSKVLSDFNNAGQVVWSPDGKTLAILTGTSVGLVNLDTGKVTALLEDIAQVDWSKQ